MTGGRRAGWYLFGRRSGLNTLTPPGTSRLGQFCAHTKVTAQYTEAQVRAATHVTSICNGEDLGANPRPVSS